MTHNVKEDTGLVVAHFGHRITIETQTGELVQCHVRRNQSLPVVGDLVRFSTDGHETGVVLGILPRRSLLQRGDPHGRGKPLAANIDLLVIVMAPPPILSVELVDRYTVAAALLGIKPVLVINKMDLMTVPAQEALRESLAHYNALGCPVIFASCFKPDGLQALFQRLAHQRGVLVGPSGVGKSSIIKQLTELDVIVVGDVSDKGIGKHTTTATRLYHLPEGGELIDSPGLRDFNLWSIGEAELFQGFTELKPHVNCRFTDCAHLAEPDCGVRLAVNAGKISTARYEHYCKWRHDIKQAGREK